MNERISKNLIKQDEYFQSFAIGRDIGEARGLQEGKTLGIQEGIRQKQNDMVINLHNQGIKLSIIANASGLSEAEVNEIINDSSSKIKKK